MATRYELTMTRPDRKRVVKRYLHEDGVRVNSDAQLFGYVNHKLLSDAERGPDGTVYTLKISNCRQTRVTTMKKVSGRYRTI